MAAKLWETAAVNAFSTTLNGNITDADDTVTLTTVANLVAPGVLVIDRQDANGNNTPSIREYISFTGISGSDLTGVARGLAGSTAQAHSSGSIVEEVFSVSHWNQMVDFLQVSHDAAGNIVVSSTATISTLRVFDYLNASGASIVGNFPIHPTWVFEGAASTPSTGIGKPLSMPQEGLWSSFSAVLGGPASGATLVLDINKNGSSIFEATTRLMIAAGGTFASTASINTKSFVSGDVFKVDLDLIGNTLSNVGVSVMGRSNG